MNDDKNITEGQGLFLMIAIFGSPVLTLIISKFTETPLVLTNEVK